MFTSEEIIKLKRLCQDISYRLLPLDQQESIQRDGALWCMDWWGIEALKCLFLGEQVYKSEPVPRRLRNNHLFSKDYVCETAEQKREMLRRLRENVNHSDNIVICEVGHGIDVLMASFAKPWGKYYVYDSNEYALKRLKRYFVDENKFNMEIACISSDKYQFPKDRPIVAVVNLAKGLTEADLSSHGEGVLSIFNGKIIGESVCKG